MRPGDGLRRSLRHPGGFTRSTAVRLVADDRMQHRVRGGRRVLFLPAGSGARSTATISPAIASPSPNPKVAKRLRRWTARMLLTRAGWRSRNDSRVKAGGGPTAATEIPADSVSDQICEYAVGRKYTVVMFETISASLYPGVADSFFHSGSLRNASQLFSRPAMLSCTSI
jgi:hypothetical protein